MRHVVIIPARNEAQYIEKTLDSLLGQEEAPDRIYVVDDGSTDATVPIITRIAAEHPSVLLLRKGERSGRLMGSGVVQAFNLAYAQCRAEQFTYVSKIDADLIFPADYFRRLLEFMDGHPEVGAASGILYDKIGDDLMELRLPENHVPGALKTYRKEVFDSMGGFFPVLGWDIVDLVKLRSMGWGNVHLRQLKVIHLRQHASAEGVLKGKAQWGAGAYVIGSHPLFVLVRGLYRMFEPPYLTGGLAFWWGYVRAALTRVERISDQALIGSLRKEQLYRLCHFNRLPNSNAQR